MLAKPRLIITTYNHGHLRERVDQLTVALNGNDKEQYVHLKHSASKTVLKAKPNSIFLA